MFWKGDDRHQQRGKDGLSRYVSRYVSIDPCGEEQAGSRAMRHPLRQGGFALASAHRREKKELSEPPPHPPGPCPSSLFPFFHFSSLGLEDGKLAKTDRNCIGIAGRGLMWEIKSRLYPYILSFKGMIASYPFHTDTQLVVLALHSPSTCHKGLDSRGEGTSLRLVFEEWWSGSQTGQKDHLFGCLFFD